MAPAARFRMNSPEEWTEPGPHRACGQGSSEHPVARVRGWGAPEIPHYGFTTSDETDRNAIAVSMCHVCRVMGRVPVSFMRHRKFCDDIYICSAAAQIWFF